MIAVDICQASLQDALDAPALRLAEGCILGVCGILGWGLCVEVALRRFFGRFSVAHAFLNGVAIVSLLLLTGTISGFCHEAGLVAFTGVAAGAVSLWALRRANPNRVTAATPAPDVSLSARSRWLGLLMLVIGLPLSLRLVAVAMPLGSDLTAIWAFHGKVLACECLFDSHYVKEPVWAGTHPDYPLLAPLLYSYFFRLTGSFRDDWVKIWESIAWLATLSIVFGDMRRATGRDLYACAANVALLGLIPLVAGPNQNMDGHVDLIVLLFSAVITSSLFAGDFARLPIFLFGLLFTKNEGMMLGLAFIGLHTLFVLASFRAGPLRQRLRQLRYIGPAILLGAVWIAVFVHLPQRHENYPSRLLDPQAWTRGLTMWPAIWRGWRDMLTGSQWLATLLVAPPILAACLWRLRDPDPAIRRSASLALLSLSWFTVVMAAFFCIYLVTPWGSDLYQVTLGRILAPAFPPLAFAVLVGASIIAPRRLSRTTSVIIACALAACCFGWGASFVDSMKATKRELDQMSSKGTMGAGYYLRDPSWAFARSVDAHVAPAASGALIGTENYFISNYALYPRRLYPASPETLAGTWREWHPWLAVPPNEVSRLKLGFITDTRRMMLLPPPQ